MFLSIDLDAFYCGVEEHRDPRLRDEPFCVVQKFCVATVSYPARAMGIQKLANFNDVKKEFPNMKFVNGEDLSKYREAGKRICEWVHELLGKLPVERLGLEEMRLDITSIVHTAMERLPGLADLHEWLQDPDFMDEVAARGLSFTIPGTATEVSVPNFFFSFEGHTWPPEAEQLRHTQSLEAYVAGHLAAYVRDRMWLELGYSCSIGVATTKNYAKMIGNLHKPRGVTVLQPGSEAEFMKTFNIRKIPGLGRACIQVLQCSSLDTGQQLLDRYTTEEALVARLSPVVGPKAAQSLWSLLMGDDTEGHEIQPYELPTQVSIEDSYGVACPQQRWLPELKKLCEHLMSQAAVEWYDDNAKYWERTPVNFRLSVIFADGRYQRRSKSVKYTWKPETRPEALGSDLVQISMQLIQQLAKLHGGKPRVINVALVS